jgi:hypothetical protein
LNSGDARFTDRYTVLPDMTALSLQLESNDQAKRECFFLAPQWLALSQDAVWHQTITFPTSGPFNDV